MNIMNINVTHNKLAHYTMDDYYNKDKQFTPYLWTSAYGLLTLIHHKHSNKDIKKYIRIVHRTLGSFEGTKLSTKISKDLDWRKSLTPETTDLVNHSVKGVMSIYGGLRIGKAEQGQEPGIYLHYCTKWVYSLIKASQHLNDSRYLYQACQLMLTACEKNMDYHDGSAEFYYPRKMNVSLTAPIQPSEISHDPLDVFITLNTLILNLRQTSKINKLSRQTNNVYQKILLDYLELATKRVYGYLDNPSRLYTNDALGIGFLLTSCLKIRKLIEYAKSHTFITKYISPENLYKLYEILLDNSLKALRTCDFNRYKANNDGYRWFGICIGLEAINILFYNYTNNYIDNDKYFKKVKLIMGFYNLKRFIRENFSTYSYNNGNWDDHKDINIVMFFNTEFPILSL
jgi:hypothetical protein